MPKPNADHLGARRAKPPRRRADDVARHRTERGGDPAIRDFDQGPFPHQPVAPFPPLAVELVERLTGTRFPVELIATWERVRAFTGYVAFETTPALQVAARPGLASDPKAPARGAPAVPEVPERARHLATRTPPPRPEGAAGSSRMPDPADLGDDD